MTATGRVWLVGAGPGDPDLLTVAGRRLIDTADAVVHDRLVGDAILASIPATTARYDVGKEGHGQATDQREITGLLVLLARRGLQVVRLKGGDPFVYGRGGEEAIALRAAGVEVRVVPGVTSGIAGPAAAGIPVTHRGLARSVAFITGHTMPDGGPPGGWTAAAGCDTVVAYMAARTADAVGRSLLGGGRRPDTPVAVLEQATLPGERVTVTDLGALATDGVAHRPGVPVLLVIGEVVWLRQAIAAPAPGRGSERRPRPEPGAVLVRR
jgi:uroporphyrin-III C-methyltransferase